MDEKCTLATSWLGRVLTFFGKRGRRPEPTSVAPFFAILLLLNFSDQAMAQSQIGPTSSGSVRISVSVAQKYGLGAGGRELGQISLPAGRSDRLCLTSNGGPLLMPVMLVWPQATPLLADKEAMDELPACDFNGDAAPKADGTPGALVSGLVLIRPE